MFLDATTLAAYRGANGAQAKAEAVRDSLGSGTLTVELKEAGTVRYSGTFSGPLTANGGAVSASTLLSGVSAFTGMPSPDTWICRVRNGGDTRWLEASIGDGGRFTIARSLKAGQAVRLNITISSSDAAAEIELVQQADLVYRGAFRLPDYTSEYDENSAAYNGEGLAFRSDGDDGYGSLFVSGHQYYFKVAEIGIPDLVISDTVGDLNRAWVLQSLISTDNGFTGNLGDVAIANEKRSGGLMVYAGELWENFYPFYDAPGDQKYSLTKRPLTLSPTSAGQGVYRFDITNATVVSSPWACNRYLGRIPAEWQTAFGAPCFAGGSTGFSSIASLQSNGPAFVVFDPASLSGTSHKSTVTAQQALAYPVDHPLSEPAQQSAVWNFTSSPIGAVIPSGTRSVLFFGTHGVGAYSYPPEAPPYKQYVWAYDIDDLLDGLSGAVTKYDIQPYAVWDISDLFSLGWIDKWSIRGLDIDHATNRIYVYCRTQDGSAPLVHVIDVVI